MRGGDLRRGAGESKISKVSQNREEVVKENQTKKQHVAESKPVSAVASHQNCICGYNAVKKRQAESE